ncbi:RNA polymerase sigma factor [Cohnella suwonensis]|uniref:RNA polymerase sigma factor n=1 Tax=Cohnella suwonensis TaxID=696072 RepID=A0ABW0LYU6_9BACL
MEERYLKDALEEGQLEHLITAYWNDVWNYVYVMTGDRSASDDLAQETFIRAFRSLSSYRGDASYRTWLLRIARNAALNYRRSSFFRRIVLFGDVPVGRKSRSAETEYMEKERVSEMWREVFRLPAKMREVLLLDAKYDMSIRDIAELLGLPEGTVKSRLSRARSRMEAWLKGELWDA